MPRGIKRLDKTTEIKKEKKMSNAETLTITNVQGIELELTLPITVRGGLVIDAEGKKMYMNLINAESRGNILKLVTT